MKAELADEFSFAMAGSSTSVVALHRDMVENLGASNFYSWASIAMPSLAGQCTIEFSYWTRPVRCSFSFDGVQAICPVELASSIEISPISFSNSAAFVGESSIPVRSSGSIHSSLVTMNSPAA